MERDPFSAVSSGTRSTLQLAVVLVQVVHVIGDHERLNTQPMYCQASFHQFCQETFTHIAAEAEQYARCSEI